MTVVVASELGRKRIRLSDTATASNEIERLRPFQVIASVRVISLLCPVNNTTSQFTAFVELHVPCSRIWIMVDISRGQGVA